MCGLTVPLVIFDQLYSFDRDALIKSIPRPDKASAKEFTPLAEEVFDRMTQLADNAVAPATAVVSARSIPTWKETTTMPGRGASTSLFGGGARSAGGPAIPARRSSRCTR
jgi:hypothetical protein